MSDDTYYEVTIEFPLEDDKLQTHTFYFESIAEVSPRYRTLTKDFLQDIYKLITEKTYTINGMLKNVKKITNDAEVGSPPVDKIHVMVVSPKGQKKLQLGFLIAEIEKFISIIGLYPEDFYREALEKPYLFQNITTFIVMEPWRFQWGMYSSIKENIEKLDQTLQAKV
ncbi:MAG: hypothetical protein ACFFBD_01625 [Candidatus Hodarchaeota archaeon]